MKRKKIPLFAGIVFLVFGVILRFFTDFRPWPVYIIIFGALCKIYFIIGCIKRGEYKPGIEVGLLYSGVALFLTGLYFRRHSDLIKPIFFILPGVSLKLSFIITFIIKLNRNRTI